ncbi:hypothetical protein BW730_03865 [Tessaracoccus aquimaris]|uniref:GAF domain-containing protein n=1 Tax=Tessaracoccus aquimaris TaxID=1332264 RepID=A0A1Q2CL04_9ACTN|nr:helix-turn-helix domain-containing protein [Tessaracoccus aquimaris]AQP46793.1 hypothetical protein BW730_03865 [Tessaracoccus aquimaris]
MTDLAIARLLSALEGGLPGDLERAVDDAGLSPDAAASARRVAATCAAAARSRLLVDTLYDTATDLAGIADPDQVLAAIAQRTRAVTGADMAYVSLNDHATGETYICQSDGVRTREYATIRMPLGTGVLGKAATGMAVVSTSDYVDDPTIVHLDPIDAIVRLEGVKSILGVPMNVQGRIQGALLIADRRQVDYPAETREIVDAIARQAAVAIDHSARLAHVTAALEELGAREDAGRARMGAMQSLLDFDRRLVEAVGARDQAGIVGLLSAVYDARVDVLSPDDDPGDPILRAAITSAVSSGLPFPVSTPGGQATICAAQVGGSHHGTVVVHTAIPVAERDALEHAAVHLGLAALIDRIEADAEQRSQYELLDDCISGRAEPGAALRARMTRHGVDPRKPLMMLAIRTSLPDALPVVRRALRAPALVAEHGGHLCALAQTAEPCARRVWAALAPADPDAQVGSSRVHGNLGDIPRAHRSADTALASLRLLGGEVLDGDTIGSLGALLEAEQAGSLPRGVRAPALPLVDYDAGHGTDLVRTAWAVLEFGPQLPAAAAALFIHPNTLRQRMHRIATLLGEGWQAGAGRLDLHLALRALMMERSRG